MRRPAILTVLLILPLAALAFATDASGRDRQPAQSTPREEALVQLGRRLFFDPLVSRSGARSCASCHDPEHGFSDPARVSEDDFGSTRRHSQTLIDTHLNPNAHWDGEFETIEELVLARIGALRGRKGSLGHGVTLLDAVTGEMTRDESIAETFGDPADDPTDEEVEEDIIDDGEVPDGGDDDGPYGGPESASPSRGARGAGSATPGSSVGGSGGSRGATGPSAPAAPSTPTTPSAPAPAAPEARPAPKADAPDGDAPQAGAQDGGAKDEPQAGAMAGPQGGAGAPDPDKPAKVPSLAERKRRAEELRAALRRLPLAEDQLESSGRYAEAFTAAFGNRRVNAQRIARAIQAYCDSLHSTTAPIDRYLAGDGTALSASAKRGLALFQGRAGCASCHSMKGEHPLFTDFAFHNTGVVFNRLSAAQREALAKHDETFRRKRDALEAPQGPDAGRARISTRRADLRAFKTPTLRDLTRRGPYMHDGRFRTLRDVVDYYAKGGSPDPAKAAHVKAFKASKQDVDDLVAFLESLTGDMRPGLPEAAWRTRAAKTRLQFVDADRKPLVGLTVGLRAVGDTAYRGSTMHKTPTTLTTDAKGWIEFTQRRTTHTRLVLPEGLEPAGGAWVPDSCEKAQVVVPVRGKAEILVRMHAPTKAPATLAGDHLDTFVLPGHQAPRTRFTRGETLDLGRTRIVTYRGWLRTDVPNRVRLRVPGLHGASRDVELVADTPARVDLTK